MEEPMPMTYPPLKGNSKTRKDTVTLSKQYFKKFLDTKFINTPVDDLTEEQACNEELLVEFATFLTQTFQILNPEEFLRGGTATGYYGSIKTFFFKKFPNNDLWKDMDWYSDQRVEIEKACNKNFMLRGLNAFDSTQNIGRVLIRNMGEEWLKGCLKVFELVFYYSKAHPFNPFNRE